MTTNRSGMPLNQSIPDTIVMPVIRYPDVPAAAEWLCRAFGFTVRLRIADHRIQLNAGNGALIVCDGYPASPANENRGAAYFSTMIRVLDADAHCARAKAAGAAIAADPQDHPYGERQYSAQDPWGYRWTFSQTIADVDPASWGGIVEQS